MNVATVGYPSMDMILKVGEFKEVGKTTILTDWDRKLYYGGCGLNIAVGLKTVYGLESYPITTFGTDENYESYSKYMEGIGVSTKFIQKRDGLGAYSIIIADSSDKQMTFFFPGTSDNVRISGELFDMDLEAIVLTVAPWKTVKSIINKFWDRTKLFLSAKIDPYSMPLEVFVNMLSNVDGIILNEHEYINTLKIMSIDQYKDFFKKNQKLKWIVITKGSKGCTGITREGDLLDVSAKKVTVVDPTGAGDAFAVGFFGTMLKTRNFKKSLKAGNEIASMVISQKGAQTTYTFMDHIDHKRLGGRCL